jgi:hypothetical protein
VKNDPKVLKMLTDLLHHSAKKVRQVGLAKADLSFALMAITQAAIREMEDPAERLWVLGQADRMWTEYRDNIANEIQDEQERKTP